MEIVVHRVNTIKQLKTIPAEYGCEVDIRAKGSSLILNHEPFEDGEALDEYLSEYNHGLLILNIKEAGIENKVLELVQKKGISRYFLLDVEFPYIYRAARSGIRSIAMRYSEDECIETVVKYSGMVEWVWIDTNTRLPIDKRVKKQLEGFKTCLVCPELWGRPHDIPDYKEKIERLGLDLNAVMTSPEHIHSWR